eukprot:Colp12_sorted_trinity150504_noHs@6989
MHVEGHLAFLLELLLLHVALLEPLVGLALGQKLLHPLATADVVEARVRLSDVAVAEGAEADLDHSAVEEDLGGHVTAVDRLLEVGHEHLVTCLDPLVVERVVVHVAEHGTCADTARGVVGVDEAAQLLHHFARVGDLRGNHRGGVVLVLVEAEDLVVDLVVHVLHSAEVHSAQITSVAHSLQELLRLLDRLHKRLLVLETLNVAGGVGVDGLEGLGELVIKTLNKGHNVAAHDERASVVQDVLLLLRDALHESELLAVLGEETQKLVHRVHAALPVDDAHMGGDVGVEVEEGGDEVEEDLDVQAHTNIVGCCDLPQLLQDLNLLETVSALLATQSDDLSQLVVNESRGDLSVLSEQGLLLLDCLWLLLLLLKHLNGFRLLATLLLLVLAGLGGSVLLLPVVLVVIAALLILVLIVIIAGVPVVVVIRRGLILGVLLEPLGGRVLLLLAGSSTIVGALVTLIFILVLIALILAVTLTLLEEGGLLSRGSCRLLGGGRLIIRLLFRLLIFVVILSTGDEGVLLVSGDLRLVGLVVLLKILTEDGKSLGVALAHLLLALLVAPRCLSEVLELNDGLEVDFGHTLLSDELLGLDKSLVKGLEIILESVPVVNVFVVLNLSPHAVHLLIALLLIALDDTSGVIVGIRIGAVELAGGGLNLQLLL